MLQAPDIAGPLRDFGGDPQRAGGFAAMLGFEQVASPVDLLGSSRGATTLHSFFRARGDDFFGVRSLFRVGGYRAGEQSVALYVAELHEWGDRYSARDRARRRVAGAVVQHTADARALIVLAPEGWERLARPEIEIVLPRVRSESDSQSAFTTVRALVDTSAPSRFHRDRIRALALDPGLSVAQVVDRWRRAFSVEEVTRKFYQAYADLRDRIAREFVRANPTHAVVPNLSEDERKAWATRQLGRVLFLWFLQAKRWLGYDGTGQGSETYLADLWRESQSNGGGYYNRVLRPLFFDALARPLNRRKSKTKEQLGPIPYLNGGLFRTNALEDRIEAVGVVDLPDDLFDPDPERRDTVLGLLGHYHFTTRESTPDDQSVDPDPELLGRVFENLYQGDARHDSGTYYTPREIVHFMCRQALHGWLSDRTGADLTQIELLRLEAVEPQDVGDDELIDEETAQRLSDELDVVRICDPAVGSGAFLLGAMQEITQLRRGLALAAGASDEDIEQDVAIWKRRAIQWSLYGVDINPEAVEICHLRLWLSLVLDLQSPLNVEPLPNLDFRVVAGDSLIDRLGDVALPDSLPLDEQQLPLDSSGRLDQQRRLIDRWKREFDAEHDNPARLRELRKSIARAVRRILTAFADIAIERERQRRQEDRDSRAARARIKQLERARADVDAERRFWKPFLWPVLFHEVFGDGGFDLVLANPPYVRQERISADDQRVFEAAFPEVYAGTADLLVFFYARGMQILRDGGWLAFVTSNKYMRAAYGRGLREQLANTLALTRITDLGDLPVFDSNGQSIAAYPSVVIGRRETAETGHTLEVADLTWPVRHELAQEQKAVKPDTVRDALNDLDALHHARAVRDFPQLLLRREGWILEDPVLVRLFERLMSVGMPLGEYVQGRLYRGIVTGLNDAFVIDRSARDALVAADPNSAEVIKPWLRGRDIKRWRAEWAGLYLVKLQNSGDADAANPWADATNEINARQVFAATYPAIHDHMSKFEGRLRPRADQGRFWWELRSCAYYGEFEQPKVVFNRFINEAAFAYDKSGTFHNDACYLLCADSPALAAVVTSYISWWLLKHLATRLQNGYIQIFVNQIERLPIPVLDSSMEAALSAGASQLIADPQDSARESAVEDIVADAYGLSPVERRMIQDWLIENSSAVDAG